MFQVSTVHCGLQWSPVAPHPPGVSDHSVDHVYGHDCPREEVVAGEKEEWKRRRKRRRGRGETHQEAEDRPLSERHSNV